MGRVIIRESLRKTFLLKSEGTGRTGSKGNCSGLGNSKCKGPEARKRLKFPGILVRLVLPRA